MTIRDIVNQFHTTPFLFVGSGLTRRYLNLPDWRGLLEHFAFEIRGDEFSFQFYERQAKNCPCKYGILPKAAELIQKEYDEKWFAEETIRHACEENMEKIRHGLSPFKAEVAEYLKQIAVPVQEYEAEINKLSYISEKSIAGVITTNYDLFLESHLQGFVKYIGQSQLIFAPLHGVAEIYKIHGSVEEPDSLIITEQDYQEFDEKRVYLAAKLMTLFVEYPIIFLGYSISDLNIRNIIKSIVNCLDDSQADILQNRFIFVEYEKGHAGADVSQCTFMLEDRMLQMQKIVLDDFMLLYQELDLKKSKLPVRLLRHFKQELYDFVLTSTPTTSLRVAALDDQRVADEELVLAICKPKDIGLKGLSGIHGNDWYRNIVMDDLEFTADDLLEHAYPEICRQYSGKIPIHKYLSKALKRYPECEEAADKMTFDNIISATNKKNRKYLGDYGSVKQIWDQEHLSRKKAFRRIAWLTEDQIDVVELECVLKEVFEKDMNILEHVDSAEKSALRLLIRIYDYLKWGKTKEPSN